MSYSVKDVADLCGVSIRTLHYYDEIGLLVPQKDLENGYRCYDENDILRLQQILFFRELEFSLKEIREILSRSDYDRNWILSRQKAFITKKRDHYNDLIDLIDSILNSNPKLDVKGDLDLMKDQFSKEVRSRWGDTDAYSESLEKHSKYSSEDEENILTMAELIFKKFASLRDRVPSDENVQALVQCWQNHISENHYQCSNDILRQLGIMYAEDERFRRNLDRFGEGTASFMAKAIAVYVDEKD